MSGVGNLDFTNMYFGNKRIRRAYFGNAKIYDGPYYVTWKYISSYDNGWIYTTIVTECAPNSRPVAPITPTEVLDSTGYIKMVPQGWATIPAHITSDLTITCTYTEKYYFSSNATNCTASIANGWYTTDTTITWTANTLYYFVSGDNKSITKMTAIAPGTNTCVATAVPSYRLTITTNDSTCGTGKVKRIGSQFARAGTNVYLNSGATIYLGDNLAAEATPTADGAISWGNYETIAKPSVVSTTGHAKSGNLTIRNNDSGSCKIQYSTNGTLWTDSATVESGEQYTISGLNFNAHYYIRARRKVKRYGTHTHYFTEDDCYAGTPNVTSDVQAIFKFDSELLTDGPDWSPGTVASGYITQYTAAVDMVTFSFSSADEICWDLASDDPIHNYVPSGTIAMPWYATKIKQEFDTSSNNRQINLYYGWSKEGTETVTYERLAIVYVGNITNQNSKYYYYSNSAQPTKYTLNNLTFTRADNTTSNASTINLEDGHGALSAVAATDQASTKRYGSTYTYQIYYSLTYNFGWNGNIKLTYTNTRAAASSLSLKLSLLWDFGASTPEALTGWPKWSSGSASYESSTAGINKSDFNYIFCILGLQNITSSTTKTDNWEYYISGSIIGSSYNYTKYAAPNADTTYKELVTGTFTAYSDSATALF